MSLIKCRINQEQDQQKPAIKARLGKKLQKFESGQ